jgi:hypothetical protein
VDAVLSLPNLDWCWVDFHIGVGFERATEKAEAWSADDVWRRVAQPWAAWIR